MDSYITDERNGLNYKLVGDYYLPMIKAHETPEIGQWGRRHLRYLKENRKAFYTALMLSGKLFDQAAEIDRAADELCNCLIEEMAIRENVNEDLKARNQMEWVRCMNSIQNRAEEIVSKEMIYS